MIVLYLVFSVFPIKRTDKYLLILSLSLALNGLLLLLNVDDVVFFFNNIYFKILATLAITTLIYLRVLKPFVSVSNAEDRQIAIIFRALIILLVLLVSHTVIFSLGLIVQNTSLVGFAE